MHRPLLLLIVLLLLGAGGSPPRAMVAAAAPAPHALPWLWSGILGLSPACNEGVWTDACHALLFPPHPTCMCDSPNPSTFNAFPHHHDITNPALARLEAGLAAQDGKAVMAAIEAKVVRRRADVMHDSLCVYERLHPHTKQFASGHVIEGLMAFAQGVRMARSRPLTSEQVAHFAWG